MKKLLVTVLFFLAVFCVPAAVDAGVVPHETPIESFFCDDFLETESKVLIDFIEEEQEPSQDNMQSNNFLELDADDDLIPELMLSTFFLTEINDLRLLLPKSFFWQRKNQPPPRI